MNLFSRTIASAALVLASGTSFAVVAYPSTMASAWIDWSGLTITTIGFGGGAAPGYSLSESGDYVSASNEYDYDSDTAGDWTTGTSAMVTSSDASAMTTASGLSAMAAGSLSAGYAYADANRYGSIDVTGGPGLLIVTVPYQLEISGNASDIVNAYASIGLYNQTSGSGGDGWDYLGDWSTALGASGMQFADGYLSASVYVLDGDMVTLNAWVDAEVTTVVPLPAAAWMFGAAVLAFAGVSARRRV